MKALLLQLDGKIPNLALMRLAGHLRGQGADVELRHLRSKRPTIHPEFTRWDQVFASLIFTKTRPLAERLLQAFPGAVIGGSGWDESATLERIGVPRDERPDYSDFPAFRHSMGFTQRGCRLRCSFCAVPRMEGGIRRSASVLDVWRGEPWPRNLLLLDNDFFGGPAWRDEVEAIRDGGFLVCWNQGINVRAIGDEEAAAIASVRYSDDQFSDRRLYTAWDNARDEDRLFVGLDRLVSHGVKPDDILVYMLIGYDHRTKAARPHLTADDFFRHDRLREFGCRPYPMPYTRARELVDFQRWVVKRIDCNVSWNDFRAIGCRPERIGVHDEEPTLFAGVD